VPANITCYQFGPDGLQVDLESKLAKSRLGSYYAVRPDGKKYLFTDAEKATADIVSLKVFITPEIPEGAQNYSPNPFQWS